jgi:hypothetical protein
MGRRAWEDRAVGLIEVIMTVCSLTQPGCQEKHLQFVDQGATLTQCEMEAPIYMAAWSNEHPGQQITKWRCAYPNQEDKPI